jgi:CubicO group peptidase (beta-lactamase class C family)
MSATLRLRAFLAPCVIAATAGRLAAQDLAAEWPRASMAEVGMDSAHVALAMDSLPGGSAHGLHSMLVVRRGTLVYERYWSGHAAGTLHDLRSATKSITSLLTGIAIERGHLPGVDAPMLPYLAPRYADLDNPHEAKSRITLAHLLTMRGGLACDDHDRRSPGQEDRMYRSRDWVRHFLELPVAHEPGDSARYCTGGVVALGRVLAEASGTPVPELARDALFAPLGIEQARWATFDGGRQTDTGGHLRLRPRDMAKIGQLVLQEGRWDGRQVVPAAWIRESTSMHTRLGEGRPYGYLWWQVGAAYPGHTVRIVHASGNGGQFIFIVPDLELVAVFTGGTYDSPRAGLPLHLLATAILPATEEIRAARLRAGN